MALSEYLLLPSLCPYGENRKEQHGVEFDINALIEVNLSVILDSKDKKLMPK
jgi:hypothetical protein